jgi:heterodisulfide reductase subunit A
MELEELLQRGGEQLKGKKNIVMIQCVGSRDEERPYCSRVCCNQAIKNALALKEMDPDRNITILYRDIRAYGLHETDYRRGQKGRGFSSFATNRTGSLWSGNWTAG